MVRAVESARSLQAAADGLRLDLELPGALRWIGRRVQRVHRALTALRGLHFERFASVPATVTAFAAAVGVEPVLPALREFASPYLAQLPAPLGFHHRHIAGGEVTLAVQQSVGPDPPRGRG